MQFLFNMMNHSLVGQRSLEDVIGILGHQLRALGHTAVWEQANNRLLTGASGINIIVEGFVPEFVKVIADAHAQGSRFLCLATEEPTEKGFNQGTQIEMVKRQEMFAAAAPYLEGILYLVPGDYVAKWYGQHAPSAFADLGYAPTLVRLPDYVEPAYDFGFFGSLSPRRLKILKKLARVSGKEKAVKIEANFATQGDRDRIMREAKVIVQIRKFEAMGLVSSSRCNTALCIGRPVIAEPHLNPGDWENVVKFSKSLETFFHDAIMVRAMWRGVHAKQMADFKERMTPEHCVGRALREIGILERKAA